MTINSRIVQRAIAPVVGWPKLHGRKLVIVERRACQSINNAKRFKLKIEWTEAIASMKEADYERQLFF